MKIVNVFDAVKEGDYKEFKRLYNGDINQINKYTKLNLLLTSVVNDVNIGGKKKIIKYLIKNGIDINFIDAKYKRSALHTLLFCVIRGDASYLLWVVEQLVKGGIDVNAEDVYGTIPLSYAITVNKLPTEDMKEVYLFLLKSGSNYKKTNNFNKSCVDYAEEYSWRKDFLEIVKECKNDK